MSGFAAFRARAGCAGHFFAISVPTCAGEAAWVADGFKFSIALCPNLHAVGLVFEGAGVFALNDKVLPCGGGIRIGGWWGWLGRGGLLGGGEADKDEEGQKWAHGMESIVDCD